MDAATLNCPMCGAAAASDANHCEHCGARLATVSCPACFGLMFAGEKFCPHCGAKADRAEVTTPDKPQPCPRCATPLEAVTVGAVTFRECPKCEGLWCDADSLRQICVDREKQAAVAGMARGHEVDSAPKLETLIRYLPCPACRQLMNRVNFANCSGVIVDVCRAHGTWFDRDELNRVVQFIQAGGLEKSHQNEIEDLKNVERRAQGRQLEALLDRTQTCALPNRYNFIFNVAGFLLNLLK